MLYIAWWTGRGYLTIPIVLGSAAILEFIRTAAGLSDGIWVVGIALFVAAGANWYIGTRLNSASIRKIRSFRLRDRLLYRARNKFMSLPMETMSILLAIAGAGFIAVAALSPIVAQDKCLDSGGAIQHGACVH